MYFGNFPWGLLYNWSWLGHISWWEWPIIIWGLIKADPEPKLGIAIVLIPILVLAFTLFIFWLVFSIVSL